MLFALRIPNSYRAPLLRSPPINILPARLELKWRVAYDTAEDVRNTTDKRVFGVFLSYFLVDLMNVAVGVWIAVLVGSVGGIIVGLITEYYTGGSPVEKIAKDGETGSATVLISGLATGMQSVAIPVLTIVSIIFISNIYAGLYGVGIAAVGMLSTVGITMAIDAYGPVADNAGGIAEMSEMGKETREITDSLDEVGNTTAAIGKGFAISAAALAALALISAYIEKISISDESFVL